MNNRWKCFYGILIFLAAEAIQLMIIVVLQIIYGSKSMSGDLLYLISVVAVIGCGFVFFFWYRGEIRGEIRGKLQTVITKHNLISLLLLGVGCQFAITGVICILEKYLTKLFADYAEQMEQLTGGNIIVVLLLMILVAPITEELIFRGVILHNANRYVPFWGANLIQAILFGIYHFNIIQGIYAALLGFLLGLVYRKFRNIIAPMILHMIVNTSSLLVILVPDNGLGYGFLILSGGIITAVALKFLNLSDVFTPDESSLVEKDNQPFVY